MVQEIHNILANHTTFLKGILVAVLLAALTKLGQWLWDFIVQLWQRRNAYDITGTWIGDCWLPGYQAGEPGTSVAEVRELEIWHYRRKGEQVKLKFFSYNPNGSPPRKWLGGGIFRGPKLSCFYYVIDRRSFESGVIALELKSRNLKGVYAQFDPKLQNDPLYVSEANYYQTPIQLSFYRRLRIIFNAPPFRTYNEVLKLYQSVAGTSHRAAPAPGRDPA